jgi:endonuclease I
VYLAGMKKVFLIALFQFIAMSSFAQYLTLSTDTVDLGIVFEDQADSALVYVKKDPGQVAFAIHTAAAFPFYGDTVVHVRYQNQLVHAGDSLAVWVVAKPRQNVMHKGCVVLTDEISGQEVIIPYKFQGRFSKTYYSATENKTEAALRAQLKTIISTGYVQLSYNAARDEMYSDLDNVNGDVACVYTGRTATFNTRTGATANSFNCEHTFPQSLFNQNLPMRSDIRHLFPTDINANSQRANLPFGVVNNPTWQQGGSKKDNNTFEPRDAQKGATARALMYFVTRYQDFGNHFAGQENILRQWHKQFPPGQSERNRNDGIYQLQNNRNPFVDYPQFTERITHLVGATASVALPAHAAADTLDLVYLASGFGLSWYNRFYIVNTGNVPVSIRNFQRSAPNFFFVGNSGSDTTINPQHALEVKFWYDESVDYSGEYITFETNYNGLKTDTVFFRANSSISVDERDLPSPFEVTINNKEVSWIAANASGIVRIYSQSGQLCAEEDLASEMIRCDGFSRGVYMLVFQTTRGQFSQKFVLVR